MSIMLEHFNEFIPKMNEDACKCFESFVAEEFSIDIQIRVKPSALRTPDIQDLQDKIYIYNKRCNSDIIFI